MKSIQNYILEGQIIKTDVSKFDLDTIPIDSSFNDDIEGYEGPDFSLYKYFGDCKNTVDVDRMWDATQMSNFISSCDLMDIQYVIDKLNDGDRKIPAKFKKVIDTLQKENKIEDLSEICCAISAYQKILVIYISQTDTHYFFDCKR